jgi:predicted Zn-dependent protease
VIRVVTLEEYDPKELEKFCRLLYTAFGVGCEHSGQVRTPGGMEEPYEAPKLLEDVEKVRAYADDKVIYLTQKKFRDRELPTGKAPTHGLARYGGDRAVLSTHPHKKLDPEQPIVARHALHQLGHLWELHHCLDPRCAMYPSWTPSFANGDAIFCPFCREKSESRIRAAKS